MRAMFAGLLALMVLAVFTPALSDPSIVGLSGDELIACAGLPSGQMQTGQSLYWQFRASFSLLGLPTKRSDSGCEATVTLKNGVVTGVRTQAFGGILGGPLSCQRLFAECRR